MHDTVLGHGQVAMRIYPRIHNTKRNALAREFLGKFCNGILRKHTVRIRFSVDILI